MNTAKIIAWGVGGLVLYTLLSKAKALATLTFFPGNVSSVTMDGFTPVLTATLLVQNTSNQDLTITSIAGNVYSKEAGKATLIGNLSQFNPLTIPRNSEAQVSFKVRLFLIGAVNDIIKLIQYGGGAARSLELDGSANVEQYQVPLKMTFKIGN